MDPAAAVAIAFLAVAQAVATIYFTRKLAAIVSEMASRIQHPELVSHKAALDFKPEPELPPDDPELYLAGRVFNGDEPADDAPSPDPRVT